MLQNRAQKNARHTYPRRRPRRQVGQTAGGARRLGKEDSPLAHDENDVVGDCTCACAGHMIEQWTTYSKGVPFTPTDQQVIAAYSAITGYDPSTGNNDDGAAILDVLNYWRKTGVAGHRIMAFATLDPSSRAEVEDSVFLFGNCYLGVQLPVTAQNQTVWAVPPGGATGPGAPGSWGGHANPVVAYDQRGLTVVTWGGATAHDVGVPLRLLRRGVRCSQPGLDQSNDEAGGQRIRSGGARQRPAADCKTRRRFDRVNYTIRMLIRFQTTMAANQ
jgi:hypothetical protein